MSMAKLKNYTKIGQGILLGIDVTLGGYAYHELLVNLYIGIIVGIFAVVIAIIAFAPEEYSMVSATESAVQSMAKSAGINNPVDYSAMETALLKLKSEISNLSQVDTKIGESGSVITALETQLKSDPALYGAISKMLNTKSLSAVDIKSLEPLIKSALQVLSSMGVPVKSVDNVLPLIESILQTPEALSIINNILKTL